MSGAGRIASVSAILLPGRPRQRHQNFSFVFQIWQIFLISRDDTFFPVFSNFKEEAFLPLPPPPRSREMSGEIDVAGNWQPRFARNRGACSAKFNHISRIITRWRIRLKERKWKLKQFLFRYFCRINIFLPAQEKFFFCEKSTSLLPLPPAKNSKKNVLFLKKGNFGSGEREV